MAGDGGWGMGEPNPHPQPIPKFEYKIHPYPHLNPQSNQSQTSTDSLGRMGTQLDSPCCYPYLLYLDFRLGLVLWYQKKTKFLAFEILINLLDTHMEDINHIDPTVLQIEGPMTRCAQEITSQIGENYVQYSPLSTRGILLTKHPSLKYLYLTFQAKGPEFK